MPFTVKNVIEM